MLRRDGGIARSAATMTHDATRSEPATSGRLPGAAERRRPGPMDRGRRFRQARASGSIAGAHGGRRRGRLLRPPARAHALPDRVRPRRRRGPSRRQLRQVPGFGRRGGRPRRQPLPASGGGAGPGARIEDTTYDLAESGRPLSASGAASGRGVGRGEPRAVGAARSRGPGCRAVEAAGWVEAERAIKEPAEVERIRPPARLRTGPWPPSCGASSPGRRNGAGPGPGVGDADRWCRRACLRCRVPGRAGRRPAARLAVRQRGPLGQVLLFDFGAMVDGYRSDMTRTLFVGEPAERDLEIYEIVAAAQAASIGPARARPPARRPGAERPGGRRRRARVIEAAGHGEHFGHGTGHGIGLATHELPSLSRAAPDEPLPSPTVFSVEPGSTSMARPASGSRTSCCSIDAAGPAAADGIPAGRARGRRLRASCRPGAG